MKLVDLLDSKSCGSNPVSVRFRPEPPTSWQVGRHLSLLNSAHFLIVILIFAASFPLKAITLKTSFQDGVPLKFNLTDPQKLGLCAELLVLIKEIEPSINFKYTEKATTLTRIESDFKTNQLDVYPCLIYTQRRKSFLRYSQHDLFFTQHLVIGRKDVVRKLKNYKDLRVYSLKNPVLVLHGSTLVNMLQAKKIVVDNKSSTVDSVLKMLSSGRAEYYYEQNLNLGRVLEKPEYKDILIASSTPWDKNSLRFAYSRKLNKKTVTKIENALKILIESGKVNALYNKYINIK
jgi:hypothetical protein